MLEDCSLVSLSMLTNPTFLQVGGNFAAIGICNSGEKGKKSIFLVIRESNTNFILQVLLFFPPKFSSEAVSCSKAVHFRSTWPSFYPGVPH